MQAMKKMKARPTSVYQSQLIKGRRCDRAKEEEDMVMTQVKSERKKTFDGAKAFLVFLFSDVGLMVLCLVYAVVGMARVQVSEFFHGSFPVGARVFISFELPNEEKNREIKKNVALDVLDRMNYMTEVTIHKTYK